jgi:hypothetical protein
MTEFTTKLPSTIELTNEWEVGLAEIMFPRSWHTIPKGGLIIVADYRACDIDWKLSMDSKLRNGELSEEEEDLDSVVKIRLKGGFYKTMEEVTQELNLASGAAFAATGIDQVISPPTFYYREITRRIYVTIAAGMSIEFPPSLESVLGLTPEQNPMCNRTKDKLLVSGDLSCDLQTGIHALYVYCDLLQFTYVGNIKAPLLRVVDSGGETGDVVTRYYERPRYIPIQKKSFDTIQVIIRDDFGEKIQFENGKVLLTLHFRRAQNQYLI